MATPQKSKELPQLEAFMPIFTDMFMAVPRMQAAAVKACLRQQKEMLSFFDHRCDADLDLVGSVSKASDMKEIFEAYSKFLRDAAQDYAEEAQNEAEVSSIALADITTGIQAATDISSARKN